MLWLAGQGGLTAVRADGYPLACRDLDPKSIVSKSLPRGHRDVLEVMGEFNYRRDEYQFVVLSAAVQPNVSIGFWCFRYEIENTGSQDIQRVYWDKLTDTPPNEDLAPRKRFLGRLGDYSYNEPEEKSTLVYAFESEHDDVFAKVPNNKKITTNLLTPIPYDLYKEVPGFLALLQEHNLPSEIPLVFSHFDKPTNLPELSRELSMNNTEFTAVSHAVFDGKEFVVTSQVFAKSEKNLSIRAPGHKVLEQGDLELNSFLKKYDSVQSSSEELPENYIKVGLSYSQENGGRLFVVRYPVSIQVGESNMCLIVSLYSSNPFSPGLKGCEALMARGRQ